ncbi:hypothetical protein D3C76_767860 [compost metagenome]
MVDLGVAGIDRGVVVDVVDNTAIRDELVVFLEGFDFIRRLVFHRAQAAAQYHVEVVGRVQTRCGVHPLVLAHRPVLQAITAIGRGSDQVRVEIENVDGRGVVVVTRFVDETILAGHGTKDQLMLATEQVERAIECSIEADLLVVVLGIIGTQLELVVAYVVAIQRQEVGIGPRHAAVHRQLPVLVEFVPNVPEHGAVDLVQVRPARSERGGPGEGIKAAVFLSWETAPVVSAIIVLLQHGAQADCRPVAQVRFADRVEQLIVLVGPVHEAVPGAVEHDCAPAKGTLVIERAADVDLATVVVPRSSADFGLHLIGIAWALAHQVDGCRRRTGALHQAVRTANKLDAVIDCHVVHRGDVHGEAFRDAAGYAVVLQVVNLETP